MSRETLLKCNSHLIVQWERDPYPGHFTHIVLDSDEKGRSARCIPFRPLIKSPGPSSSLFGMNLTLACIEIHHSSGKDEGRGEFNKQKYIVQITLHCGLHLHLALCELITAQRWMAFNVPVGPFINLRLAISCV